MDKLDFEKVRDTVAIHVPCSSKKMGIEDSFSKLAALCAHEVGEGRGRERVSMVERQEGQTGKGGLVLATA